MNEEFMVNARFLKIDSDKPEAELVAQCVDVLKRGGSVVYPTETLYGLGVDVFNEDACSRVFSIKERDNKKPLIVHISDINDIDLVSREVGDVFFKLAKMYWPGPLTIILLKNKNISDIVSSGFDTVGVRIPNNLIEMEIIKKLGSPITGTSANLSGNEGIVDPKKAFNELKDRVDVVIDGGICEIGKPSTIVDLSSGSIKLVREGAIMYEDILKFLSVKSV